MPTRVEKSMYSTPSVNVNASVIKFLTGPYMSVWTRVKNVPYATWQRQHVWDEFLYSTKQGDFDSWKMTYFVQYDTYHRRVVCNKMSYTTKRVNLDMCKL